MVEQVLKNTISALSKIRVIIEDAEYSMVVIRDQVSDDSCNREIMNQIQKKAQSKLLVTNDFTSKRNSE